MVNRAKNKTIRNLLITDHLPGRKAPLVIEQFGFVLHSSGRNIPTTSDFA
jgi:hypothetical protein